MDYQSNSRKSKEVIDLGPKKENISKVVTGEVIKKDKSIGRKFKSIFFGGDFSITARYVAGEVLLPALRDLIVDVVAKGVERMVYGGESRYSRRPSEYRSRIQYNNPLMHRTQDPRMMGRLPDQAPRSYRSVRRESSDIIVQSREDAERVIERMVDIIDNYDTASLADLYDLLGLETSHVDFKWGWRSLVSTQIRQTHDGYLIDLPPLEEI